MMKQSKHARRKREDNLLLLSFDLMFRVLIFFFFFVCFLKGIAENHKVDAHRQDNLQVERQRKSIEWQTRQAQETERRKSIAFLEEQRVKVKETERISDLFFYCHCRQRYLSLLYTVDFHLIHLLSGQG